MNGTYVVEVQNGQAVSQPVPVGEYVQSQHLGTGFKVSSLIVWAIVLCVIGIFVKNCLVIVKQQSIKVVQRFGKFKKVLEAGLGFKVPFVDSVVGIIDLRIQQLGEDVVAKSKDNSFLTIPVKVQFQVLVGKAKEAFYTLQSAENQIKAYITNVVRSTATTMTMEEIFQSKTVFEKDVQDSLNIKFSDFGFSIVNVLVDNPMPSQEVVEAFNRVIASQRQKEAAINEAEAIRVKTVALAKAEAESLTLKATAYVEQRKIIFEGMAGIIPQEELAAYLVGIDWRDTVREAGKSGNLIVVPQGAETLGTLVAGVRK